jgi:hypothetical protein
MKRSTGWACAVAGLVLGAGSVWADGGGAQRVRARLEPRNEVPAVSSPASGNFSATIKYFNDTVEYELSYRNLQAPVTQAHIHFAQPNVNGGIMVWLCGSATNPGPAGTQPCPQSGEISGVIVPANVGAIPTQGIAVGEFDEFVRALRTGFAYVNVHTAQSTGGEIRGQVVPGSDRRDHDD